MSFTAPIGLFDSGIGGLTVLKELAERLPNESYIYLGDTARVPYGAKSKETVVRYSHNNLQFLLDCNVKMVVVACNTASSIALEVLVKESPVPVIGVIEGGVKAAINAHKKGAIGVIGTEATIASDAYQSSLKTAFPGVTVIDRACPLFVALAEEGWTENEISGAAAKLYLSDLKGKIDTLVLGCTHYPLLKKVIKEAVGDDVSLIDSARETAKLTEEKLKSENIANKNEGSGSIRFVVTDSPERSLNIGQRILGDSVKLPQPELVDIL